MTRYSLKETRCVPLPYCMTYHTTNRFTPSVNVDLQNHPKATAIDIVAPCLPRQTIRPICRNMQSTPEGDLHLDITRIIQILGTQVTSANCRMF